MSKTIYIAILTLLTIGFVCLLALRIDSPWRYDHDDNGAWYSAVARTHLIKGLSQTKGQDYFLSRSTGRMEPYLHHPPLLGLYLALVFKLTNDESPLTARLSMMALHMGSYIFFCLILGRLFCRDYGLRLWSAMVFAVAPISTFFGKMPNHEPIGLFFILGGIYFYLRYVACGRMNCRWRYPALLFWIAAVFSSWHAVLVIAAFIFPLIVAQDKAVSSFGKYAAACVLAALAVILLQILWANHWQALASQKQSLLHWINPPDENLSLSYYFACLRRVFKYSRRFYGKVPYIMAMLWLLRLLIIKLRGGAITSLDRTVLSLGAGTVVYDLIFYQAAKVHIYQQLYLLPFVAISSALLIKAVSIRIPGKYRIISGCLVIAAATLTMYYSGNLTKQIYSEPGEYAVRATSAIEQSYF